MKVRFLAIFVVVMILPLMGLSEFIQPIIQKSPLDDRQYATTVLDNGLKVVVVSDKDAPTSGAAIVVKAGLYDDPKEFSGLAHFLEHMLFLGTKRYPVPDEFQSFIQAHGGERNAMTQGDKTTFFYSIQPEAFGQSLERFADFFVSPALYPEYVDRELNAVEQEFHLFLHKDNWAVHEVNKETSNPQHPYFHHFGGNNVTLAYDKENLQKQLRKFFDTHYHANNMTLALVGPQSTQELLAFAKEYFSSIAKTPENYVRTPRKPIFTAEQLGMDIHVKSKGQYQELTLTFPFEHSKDLNKQKSQQLVAAILGYDGNGGLSMALKKMDWIVGLSASLENYSDEQDAIILNFSLTDEGIKHIDGITRHVFSAVSLIKQRGIPKHFCEEIKAINQSNFLYLEKQDATQLALAMADGLHHMPPQSLLTGHFLLSGDIISRDAIQTVLSKLTPKNMRRLVMTPNEEGSKTSKWYHASYSVEKISEAKKEYFEKKIFFSGLSLPKKNRFIPTDLKLAQKPENSAIGPSQPIKLRDDNVTLWHYQDTVFNKPRGRIAINFYVPWIGDTPESTLLAGMYSRMMVESLREEFYSAALAGARISFTEHVGGITLTLAGYSDKQDILLSDILTAIKRFKIKPAEFEGAKDTLVRRIKNFDQRTLLEKAKTELNTLLLSPVWHPTELLPVSQTLVVEQLEQFKQKFWDNAHAEMLVYGNYTAVQAQRLGRLVEQSLSVKPLESASIQGFKIAELSKSSRKYRQIPSAQENHVVVWYLQNHVKDYETLAKTVMLSNLIEVPYFQTLRVEKQLGYSLGTGAYTFKMISGLHLWIQSTKADPNGLLKEMKAFIENYKKQLVDLDESTYSISREALINQLRQPPQTLDEQASGWWSAIENGDVDFHRNEKIAQALEKLTLKQLIAYTHSVFDPATVEGQLFIVSAPLTPHTNQTEIASVKEFREHSSFVG